jgi:hypothetical protein
MAQASDPIPTVTVAVSPMAACRWRNRMRREKALCMVATIAVYRQVSRKSRSYASMSAMNSEEKQWVL